MPLFFIYPFCASGIKATIPQPTQGDGTVSYQSGFTNLYELDLNTDPSALPIPLDKSNQLYYDITSNLQDYQTHGTPPWISSADNGGSPYSYDIYARVRYDDGHGLQVYENQMQGNTNTPSSTTSPSITQWLIISGNAQGDAIGKIIDFAGFAPPTNYLNCDGSAVSRTTYASLMAAITQTQTGTLTMSMNTVTGLTSTANMYIGMPIEGTNIPSGTTVATIPTSTSITMSHNATGGGSTSIKFFNWGNGDGSTTFNIPDLQRQTLMGSGGTVVNTGSFGVGNVVGQFGGEEWHTQLVAELAAHTHNILANRGSGTTVTEAVDLSVPGTQNAPMIDGALTTGSSTPFNVIQPTTVVMKCIRYQ